MGGGDFVLPGSEYQPLHSDLGDATKSERDATTGLLTNILRPDAPERDGYAYALRGSPHQGSLDAEFVCSNGK